MRGEYSTSFCLENDIDFVAELRKGLDSKLRLKSTYGEMKSYKEQMQLI